MSYKFQKGDAKLGGAIEASQLTGTLKPSSLADATTDDIAEGSSAQYYTDARARGAVSITDAGGDGSMAYDSSTGVFTYTGPSAAEVRAHFTAGDGLAVSSGDFSVNVDDSSIETSGDALQVKALGITNAMLSGGIASAKLAELNAFDTGDLSEGSNQYFTSERARKSVSVVDAGGDGSLTYVSGTGVFTYTGPSAAEVRAHFSGAAGVDLSSGAISVNVDDSSLEISADALQVKAAGVTNAMLAGGIAASKMSNDIFADLEAIGAPSADGEFIVATGAGAFAYESGDTARTSLGLGTGDTPSFSEVSASNGFATNGVVQAGQVQASTFNGDSLAVTGITGSLNNALSAGAGIAAFTYDNGDGPKTVALSSSVAGDGLRWDNGVLSIGAEVGQVAAGDTLKTGYNFFADISAAASVSLPSSPTVGDLVVVKAGAGASAANTITINPQGSHEIDGETSLVIESEYGAISMVYVATNDWRVV